MNMYSTRCSFQVVDPAGYLQRTTIWTAASFGDAIEQAELEAYAFVDANASKGIVEYIDFVDSYLTSCELDVPEQGDEIYSLMRTIPLGARSYLRRFLPPEPPEKLHSVTRRDTPRNRNGYRPHRWFSVRSLTACGHRYEERITLWRTADANRALARASREAQEYARIVGCTVIAVSGVTQLGRHRPTSGDMIYLSFDPRPLDRDSYLDRYLRTGGEHVHDWTPPGAEVDHVVD
jgi:hypothetical protein